MGYFYFVPKLFLCYFMASLAMSARNIRTDQSTLFAFKAHVIDPHSVLIHNWSMSYPVCSWIGISCSSRHNRVIALDLSAMGLEGIIPPHLGNLSFLKHLDISENNFYGQMPNELAQLRRLKFINFADNKLSGSLPPWIGVLYKLQRLSFSMNNFSGLIPNSLYNLSRFHNLHTLMLDNNKFTGRLPENIGNWSKLTALYLGDNYLQGTGSFGSVYKGTLYDGTIVAIKVFNLQLQRAFRSFDSECEILRNVRHRNLIKIISSCCNPDFKTLVLEFMPNGSLEKWLYYHNYFLDILERLNIMIDVGSALEYLHHGHSSAPVIHCDLKPSNILLDENMVAHVSDFGISKLLGDGEDSVTQTMTMATIGYMAPEYGSEGIISAKCDVYSYGVLLMETFTRKKPTDEMFTGEKSLRNWIKESLPHALTNVVDANLVREEQAFSAKMDCLLGIMCLASACCMESPEQRVSMKDAAAKLKKIRAKFLDDVAATS